MIKKNHKIRHHRRLNNNLWYGIVEKQWIEYCKGFEMIIENGRVLFVKKGENK